MFSNYATRDLRNKPVHQGLYYNLDATLLQDINNVILGQPTPLNLNMFDIYINNSGVAIVVDLRNIAYLDFN